MRFKNDDFIAVKKYWYQKWYQNTPPRDEVGFVYLNEHLIIRLYERTLFYTTKNNPRPANVEGTQDDS